jgi:dTDP-L-rhamnose 4-epimerase
MAKAAICDAAERETSRLQAGEWDPTDSMGEPLQAVATPEDKRPSLRSIYALNKYAAHEPADR